MVLRALAWKNAMKLELAGPQNFQSLTPNFDHPRDLICIMAFSWGCFRRDNNDLLAEALEGCHTNTDHHSEIALALTPARP